MLHTEIEKVEPKRTAEEKEAARNQEMAQITSQLKRMTVRQLRLVKMVCQGILSKD